MKSADHSLHRGRVASAVAPLNSEPRIASEQLSQLLRGQSLDVLEERDDWLRVRGEDEYEGWIHRGYTEPLSEREDQQRIAGISLDCEIGAAQSRLRLPFGALLFESDSVVGGDWVSLVQQATRFPPSADALLSSALNHFAGTPYEWGGKTPWGADCSGFIQSIFTLHGVRLPRDAREQATAGRETPGDPETSGAGDLLFFSERDDGRITHVGIATGTGGMIHVSLGRGGFAVESFHRSGANDPFVDILRARFRFARRILG